MFYFGTIYSLIGLRPYITIYVNAKPNQILTTNIKLIVYSLQNIA